MTIENTRWVLAGMRGVAAQPESYMKGAPELTFGESPSLSGSTGCNSFNGSYILKGADLRLTPGAMTKMKCPGTGENDFLAALAQVTAYRIDGGMLVMLNQAGEEIMIFTLWRE
jgi:heat shock protein HslJ